MGVLVRIAHLPLLKEEVLFIFLCFNFRMLTLRFIYIYMCVGMCICVQVPEETLELE